MKGMMPGRAGGKEEEEMYGIFMKVNWYTLSGNISFVALSQNICCAKGLFKIKHLKQRKPKATACTVQSTSTNQ